jgi:ParB-like chromosome segregation protein Spo0J
MARKRVLHENIAPKLADLVRPIDGLTLDPSNARLHSSRNIEAISNSLRRFGQQKPIVVDTAGVVIAGNGTLRAAVELGWENIAASEFTGTKREATAFAIADNRTAELAEWDDDQLVQALESLVEDNFDIEIVGFSQQDLDALGADAEPTPGDPDPSPDGTPFVRECPNCGHEW